MPVIGYNLNIPAANNNPSQDQPKMQTNTNAVNTIISLDHFTFADSQAGRHKQVTLTNEAAPGLAGGNGVLYANLATGQSWPFWQNALGSFQLIGQQSIAANGYITLGGIIFQWGTDTKTTGGTVTFPLAFPTNCFSVLCTILENNNNRHFIQVKTKALANFTVASRDSGGSDESNTFSWFAVGN